MDEVYAAGGAQAVAMFAYGTDECRPVNLVTGPGNIYVAAAKRLLKGRIGIDAEAGPTEIAVLADASADPAFVAADLISQAEHDTLAAAVLVTTSAELADAVDKELDVQVAAAKHRERITAALSGRQSATVLVDTLDQGLEVVDAYAAEHLEIQTEDAAAVAARVRNAGAVFVGPHAPVSLGDYCAGSNHVLPTGGCACHSSGLSVQSFLRGIHVVDYSRDALAEVAHHVVTLARRRGPARARRRGDRPVRGRCPMTAHRRPAGPRRAARPDPVRRAPARRAGAAEHQREPVPAARAAGGPDRRAGRRGGPRAEPLPGPGRGRAAHRTGRAI